MVLTSEGVLYYCTVFFTALVFLTEASAITTNYEKSTTHKVNESQEISPQRTKLALARGSRGSLSKNQNHERVSPITFTKLNSNTKIETVPRNESKKELLIPANSGGVNDVKDKGGGGGTGGNADDDDQKTLSQQVSDGKYGLIQEEIFTTKPERLGVISYDVNPEVPKDNVNNLGGLESDDIWLAENHLLVLAGGALNDMQHQWRPIDNYVAPLRPVQIPTNPKVPPPFPIQLSENGPIEYIKSAYRPPGSFMPFFKPFLTQFPNFNKSNEYGSSLYGKFPYGPSGGVSPLRPQLKPQFPVNSNSPPSAPVYVTPPPGAEFIPPYLGNVNQSEAVDEDDPSLYYPPPYDFYYPKDNSSKVPAGPLVPGIVLPPPPNFFTLLTNNTKVKEMSKLTVVKENPYKPHYSHKLGKQLQYPLVDDENKKSATNKPAEPSTFITFNDIINEVTYPGTNNDKITYADIKVNKVSTEVDDGWIPIPAPKPFYITGAQKPLKSTVLVMMDAPDSNGYTYEKPQNTFKINSKKPTFKYLQYVDKPREKFYPTTPSSPQIVSTKSSMRDVFTTTPLSSYQPPPTIKATYYFYEEPQFMDYGPSKPSQSTSSPLPVTSIVDLNEFLSGKPTPHKTKSKGNGSNEKKRKPITPMIPIYYLAELENLVDLVKPMNLPYQTITPTPKEEYYTTTAKPSYTINKPTFERPTPKPIFEYNYIASDYNGPANQLPSSTPQPVGYEAPAHYPVEYNAYYHLSQYPQHIFNPIHHFNKPVQTTATPILFLQNVNHYIPQNAHPAYDPFDRPWMPNLNPYSPLSYPTENPYYAFFTKEEEDLIDENTKKYFTIFGQKIKQNAEATSPYSVRTPAPTTTSAWRTKYTHRGGHPSQPSTSGYESYSSTTPYSVEYNVHQTHHKKPAGYEESSTNKPLSLEGDTLVNYVTPSPTIDPDAEYVTPKISKHIRPIVVEDLPSDVNERLKNIMNLQRNRKNSSSHVDSKVRYVLIGNEYDSRQYPQNFINTYSSKYTSQPHTESYTRRQETSTPISLESDIRVNYQTSKLSKDPDAEYVENSSEYNIHKADEYDDRSKEQESRNNKPISLENDILVNYKQKGRYTTNPDAELIDSSEKMNSPSRGSDSNVISYKYPGVEHGHFYFLTPQETHLTQIENERYNFQSDVEKPSSYFKRVPRKQEQSNDTPTKN